MKILLIVICILAFAFFVWQVALFIRDLVKHIKQKKMKKLVDDKERKE